MMKSFANALLDPELPPPPDLRTWNGSDPAVRFAVHRNNVIVSLIGALADTFPVVRQLVGNGFFRAMARTYVRHHPPASPVLACYGEDFAGFITGFEPAACVPYLADVARLEYAYVHTYHAADTPALPPQALTAALSRPERLAAMRARFVPAVRLLRSQYPIISIWRAHQVGGERSGIDLAQGEAALLVRPDLEVEIIFLDQSTADFIGWLMTGESLGRAHEHAASDAALDITAVFALLLRTRALAALEIATLGASS